MKLEPDSTSTARVVKWLVEGKLAGQVEANVKRMARSEGVRHVAIMPDVHLGKFVNNGTVMATAHLVYPHAVGGDIGCGLSSLGFNDTVEFLKDNHHAQTIIKGLYRAVPVFKHRGSRILPEKLAALPLSDDKLIKDSRREGAYQLGTLGCGNHFVELQQDDAGGLWVMVHSGSRAMGQMITDFHLARAATSTTGLMYLDTCSEAGRSYFNDMLWAIEYATLNRLAILARVARVLEAEFGITANQESYLDSPHNFARREQHFGEEWIVHRKSAISARRGEAGLVAGSMGTPSFVVRGLGHEDALCSSSHGAGRILSRTEARRQISSADMQRQLRDVQHDRRHLTSLRDEAPAAYRDIRKVMRAQRDLTRQEGRFSPVLNFKYADNRQK